MSETSARSKRLFYEWAEDASTGVGINAAAVGITNNIESTEVLNNHPIQLPHVHSGAAFIALPHASVVRVTEGWLPRDRIYDLMRSHRLQLRLEREAWDRLAPEPEGHSEA